MCYINKLYKEIKIAEVKTDLKKANANEIERLKEFCNIEIPEDYIKFLLEIDDVVLNTPNALIDFWSVDEIFYYYEEYGFSSVVPKDTLVIGDDLGDIVLLYGNGNEGFGIYYTEMSMINYDYTHKICNSISEFLFEGKGLDKLFYI